MPNRRYSSSSSSAYLSSPTKSPPANTPSKLRRRKRVPEPSSTSSSSPYSSLASKSSPSPPAKTPTKSRRRRRRRRRIAELSSTSSSSAYSSSASKSPPVKRGAKKVQSEKKMHLLVVCDHEKKDVKLLTSIRTKKLIRYAWPIGQVIQAKAAEDPTTGKKEGSTVAKDDSIKVKKEPELQTFGCNVLRAIETFVRQLHSMKLTLEGKLNVKMLYWISSSKSLKLSKEAIPNLKKYTDEGAREDYNSIGTSIRKDLFSGKEQKPPADVLLWIDLMAHPFRYKYLLRYSTALLNPRAKLDHFLSLYEKLLQVQKLGLVDKTSKTHYDAVMKNIPVGASDWMKSVSKNIYVQKVYNKNKAGRSNSVFDLLKLVRDCIYHLMDHSVEHGVIKFCAADKHLMIETCFRGVFYQFQKAMADQGFQDVCLKEGM